MNYQYILWGLILFSQFLAFSYFLLGKRILLSLSWKRIHLRFCGVENHPRGFVLLGRSQESTQLYRSQPMAGLGKWKLGSEVEVWVPRGQGNHTHWPRFPVVSLPQLSLLFAMWLGSHIYLRDIESNLVYALLNSIPFLLGFFSLWKGILQENLEWKRFKELALETTGETSKTVRMTRLKLIFAPIISFPVRKGEEISFRSRRPYFRESVLRHKEKVYYLEEFPAACEREDKSSFTFQGRIRAFLSIALAAIWCLYFFFLT